MDGCRIILNDLHPPARSLLWPTPHPRHLVPGFGPDLRIFRNNINVEDYHHHSCRPCDTYIYSPIISVESHCKPLAQAARNSAHSLSHLLRSLLFRSRHRRSGSLSHAPAFVASAMPQKYSVYAAVGLVSGWLSVLAAFGLRGTSRSASALHA